MLYFIKIAGIVIVIAVAVMIFLFFIFPKFYLPVHDKNLRKIQAELIPGKTDIEYEYQKDRKEEVEEYVISLMEKKNTTATEYTFLYPKKFLKSNATYPLVVWCNGTGCTMENYKASLQSLASYGFIVVGCDDTNMGSGAALYEMALYVRNLNDDRMSRFYQRIDLNNIGVAGHSQGACGAVNCATRFPESSTMFRCLFTTSMPKLKMCVDTAHTKIAYWKYDVSKISVPYFATTGTGFFDSMWVSPLSSITENFYNVSEKIPTFMARQKGANHDILNQYHGSGYVNAWFCYMLKNDEHAAQAFIGKEELRHNSRRWKNFKSRL